MNIKTAKAFLKTFQKKVITMFYKNYKLFQIKSRTYIKKNLKKKSPWKGKTSLIKNY